jgi:hypothetical protein
MLNMNAQIHETVMTRDAVLRRLRQLCAEAGNPTEWAIRNGIRPQYVYLALQGRKPVGPQILRAIGMEREESYRRMAGAE